MSTWPLPAMFDQRFDSLVIGVVSSVEDPDGLGRVRVTLPWYASGYEEWARVSQLYAGNGYGSSWVPEEETEVLVAFGQGDMRWPYIIGCLHSETDQPPESRTSSSDIKTLQTPGGSELRFDETNKTIEVKTKNGASIKLEEDAGAITLKGTKTITLDAPEINIKGKNVTIKGDNSVAIN
jgi:phage baseplate assembly protein V